MRRTSSWRSLKAFMLASATQGLSASRLSFLLMGVSSSDRERVSHRIRRHETSQLSPPPPSEVRSGPGARVTRPIRVSFMDRSSEQRATRRRVHRGPPLCVFTRTWPLRPTRSSLSPPSSTYRAWTCCKQRRRMRHLEIARLWRRKGSFSWWKGRNIGKPEYKKIVWKNRREKTGDKKSAWLRHFIAFVWNCNTN